jgi:uncharacterized protein GlcG (DUF336 family)
MLTAALAQAIATDALARARTANSKPVAVVVVDVGGHLVAALREDGAGTSRIALSLEKAKSALALGIPTRQLAAFFAANTDLHAVLREATGSVLIPVAGGVIVRDANGLAIGAVGISGGSLDNEEDFVIDAVQAAGLIADPAPRPA